MIFFFCFNFTCLHTSFDIACINACMHACNAAQLFDGARVHIVTFDFSIIYLKRFLRYSTVDCDRENN